MKKHILIIDDEENIRKIYKRFFYALGSSVFKVIEASDADEATEYLIRERIDIVILDIKMPKIDGKVMYEVIREFNPHLKVIVASVYPVDKQKRLIPYASDYYDKSNGPMKLLEKVAGELVEKESSVL